MVKAIPVLNDEFRSAVIEIAKYGIISPVLIGIAVNIFNLPWYLIAVFIPIVLWVTIKEFRLSKKISAGMKSGKLVIDKSGIILQDGKGSIMEQTEIFPDTAIHIKGYFTGLDYRTQWWKKSSGDKPFNRISIQNPDGTQREYSFLLETNYMAVQLKNLMQHWKAKGMRVDENVLNVS